MRAPQCREGTCVICTFPWREFFHQSNSIISENPRSEIRSETCVGIMMAGATPRVRRVFCTMARREGRCRWSKCACDTRTRSIGGRSAMRRPGRRSRFNTNSHRAKLGSITTLLPPICTKKLACPMKVTPSSPLAANRGLWVCPLRGVTAECRTRRENWVARLRRAELRRVCLIILLRARLEAKASWLLHAIPTGMHSE